MVGEVLVLSSPEPAEAAAADCASIGDASPVVSDNLTRVRKVPVVDASGELWVVTAVAEGFPGGESAKLSCSFRCCQVFGASPWPSLNHG